MSKQAVPRARVPRVLLLPLDRTLLPAMEVLADQLVELSPAIQVVISGMNDVPPMPTDAKQLDIWLEGLGVGMIVLAGSVLPANLIERAKSHGIELMLVGCGAPIIGGPRRLIPGALRSIISEFREIHAKDDAAAAALSRVLRKPLPVFGTGSLAMYSPAAPCNMFELEALRDALGARPVWFADAPPHEEFETVLLAHAHALRRALRLLLIIQPKDPEEGEHLSRRVQDVGFVSARRSLDEDISETTQVYIADTDDDPGLFMRLSSVTYIGGTLTPEAPIGSVAKAAMLGTALVVGPYANGRDAALLSSLVDGGGARRIGVPPALGDAVATLLSPETGAQAALKGWTIATDGSEATLSVARSIIGWAKTREGRG